MLRFCRMRRFGTLLAVLVAACSNPSAQAQPTASATPVVGVTTVSPSLLASPSSPAKASPLSAETHCVEPPAFNPSVQSAPLRYSAAERVGAGLTPVALTVGDFNGDGFADLAAVNGDGNTISVLLGKGDGTFGPPVSYPVPGSGGGIAAADFNGDGKLDLAVVNNVHGSVSVLLGNGDGTFKPAINAVFGGQPWYVFAGKFTGAGKVDLLIDGTYLLAGNGDGTFAIPSSQYFVGNAHQPLVTVADVRGDGKFEAIASFGPDDLGRVAISPVGGPYEIRGIANGTYSYYTGDDVAGRSVSGVALADLNQDGKPDLVVSRSASDDVEVLLNRGDGTFECPTAFFPADPGPRLVTAADLNGDGTTDVAVINPAGVSVLQGNGNGTLQPPVLYPAPISSPAALVAADLRHKGKLDLIVVNTGTNDLSILLAE